ncbi:outer membrane transport energization protein ExbB (TC 2.C.1.1.1) [Geoalkalibacter ferrihydriticus]|uniref:Flagellar motor protein MotA n=2 Tax=Geoalkalibacter ferrihydriticus TaxID=392333 RepID=A0A0C2HLQ4_9BACT|nr:MotA/TolQ/ExbB proton channel family protein [Geoalkalibacter ferrihydriticus]KIH75925.1 flagellar motor protein MotA [Geoalkalibacter ferrihydriticus DSM 17813]SDM55622.1 outer membrane transport energization protein ExbB (TC 2.C.1.1.1) [Geoalkalibacter ferrihydriticus]
MFEQIYAIRQFFDAGGQVMWAILFVSIALWTLIIERYWYHWRIYPQEFGQLRKRWEGRTDCDPWQARKIQEQEISHLRHQLLGSVFLIRTFITLCPLLGLLGTVTGMIQVFDVLGFHGTGNPRAMASGVSMATIPTMSGLVVALSGLYFSIDLQRRGTAKTRVAADVLSQYLVKAEKK